MKQILVRIQYKILDGTDNRVLEFEKQVAAEDLVEGFPKELVESRHNVINDVLGAKGVYVTIKDKDRKDIIKLIKVVRDIRQGITLRYAKEVVEAGLDRGYMCVRVTSGTVHQAINLIEEYTKYEARAMTEDELEVAETLTS